MSEYLVERMILGGANRICIVIGPGKSDIVEYYGGRVGDTQICYTVQEKPVGLADAIFSALPFVRPDEHAFVGLPDTVWFPEDALRTLDGEGLSFLLFPVERPELFDAVLMDDSGRVLEIQVKNPAAESSWIWGAFRVSGVVLEALHRLWVERGREDVYVGTLVNAYLAQGGRATAVRAGASYVDVGTVHGYREAVGLLGARSA